MTGKTMNLLLIDEVSKGLVDVTAGRIKEALGVILHSPPLTKPKQLNL